MSKKYIANDTTTDEGAWNLALSEDLWIFDKLIVSRRLGYTCGARGVDVPTKDRYIIRPCLNLLGHGAGAEIRYIRKHTEDIVPNGHFWCQVFTGRHLSLDYYRGNQVFCAEGFREGKDLTRFSLWRKRNYRRPLPLIIRKLRGAYDWINVEYVGSRIIEVHLRRNPDFIGHDSPFIIPVWYNNGKLPILQQRGKSVDLEFYKNYDGDRDGFMIKKGSSNAQKEI